MQELTAKRMKGSRRPGRDRRRRNDRRCPMAVRGEDKLMATMQRAPAQTGGGGRCVRAWRSSWTSLCRSGNTVATTTTVARRRGLQTRPDRASESECEEMGASVLTRVAAGHPYPPLRGPVAAGVENRTARCISGARAATRGEREREVRGDRLLGWAAL